MTRVLTLLVRSIIALLLLTVAACSDPEVKKVRHLEKGNALAAEGKHKEAVLAYRNAIRIDPRYGEARFRLAEAYVHLRNGDQAAKEFIRAAELLPDRPDVQMKAALVRWALHDFDGTRKHAEAVLQHEPKNIDAQVLLGNALAGLKDPEGAIRELEVAMQIAPDDARPYTSLGAVQAAAGKAAEAEAAFKRAVAIDPRSMNARLALAYFFWSTARPAETERALNEALAIDREHSLANRILALFYLRHNRTSEAETPLLRLINGKDLAAKLILADLYMRTGRAAQARPLYEALSAEKSMRAGALTRLAFLDYAENKKEQAYRLAEDLLQEDPNNAKMLTLKATWLANDRRFDEALDTAKKAQAAAPDSAVAAYTVGLVHRMRGDSAEAMTAFKDALRIDSNMTGASFELSQLLLAHGQVSEALNHAQAARQAQPSNREARLVFVRTLLAKRDLMAAEAELKALQRDHPQWSSAHAAFGHLLLVKADGLGAMRAFDKALELNPSDLDALTGRVMVDVHRKQPQEARARLGRAIAQNPGDARLLVLAARFEGSAGDTAATERYLRKAIEVDSGNLDPFKLLANLYYAQKRLDEARHEFEQVVKRRPDAIPARTMIGIILDLQKRHDESRKIYEAIVNTTPRAPIAANNLAWIYAERGEQLDVALNLAQSAKEQMPDRPEVNDTLGWVYYKKNLPELAIRPLEFSVGKDPQNAIYRFHLGLVYAKAGRPDKARETLEAALKLAPDFDGADEARAMLATLKG